jgi:hypothetical protein
MSIPRASAWGGETIGASGDGGSEAAGHRPTARVSWLETCLIDHLAMRVCDEPAHQERPSAHIHDCLYSDRSLLREGRRRGWLSLLL